MDGPCIPPNPDISGIGVRAAIYAQNILCFAPVVADLWDGNVSADEMRGVKDQSIGMLAIAFAILISCIIEATATVPSVTSFHAAVILDLSWMNNTSTWIWFLLYAHHLTKPDKEKEGHSSNERKPIPAIWSDWTDALLFPLRRLVKGTGKAGPDHPDGTVGAEKGACDGKGHTPGRLRMDIWQRKHGSERHIVIQRAWYFVSQKPVLTLGSIHLSLMGALGLWLWSDESKFGMHIHDCDPSLTIVGGAVAFSSPALRIFSLAMYTLLVIPGLNLVLPFLFFLALHITYNTSRHRHPHFWRRLEDLIDLIRRIPRFDFHGTIRRAPSVLRAIPRSTGALFRRCRGPFGDVESGTQPAGAPSGRSLTPSDTPSHNQATQAGDTPAQSSLNHTAFLIVGLVCLALINVIQLVDVELTLLRNKRDQSNVEDEWGFGQVLALLLLVVPLRDFVTSILDIREKLERAKVAKEKIQTTFNDHLQHALDTDTFEGHDFKGLIEQGADPNVELEVDNVVWLRLTQPLLKNRVTSTGQILLQFAAYKGNEDLVKYLLGRGVKDNEGVAFQAAARHARVWPARLLGKDRNESDRAETRKRVICLVVESLKDSELNVRRAALQCLSGLGAQAEFQKEIQAAIVIVVELLKDSDSFVRQAALLCVSGLGAQAEFQQEIRAAIPIVVESLKDSDSNVCRAVLECLSGLGAQEEFQQEIRATIPMVIESLKDSSSLVCWAAFNCVSRLGTQSEFQQEIQAAIPIIVESVTDSNAQVCRVALECLSGLGAQAEFQKEIRAAIVIVVELLKDSDSSVRQAALECLSGLGAQGEFEQEIRAAIPIVVESLKDSDSDVRRAACECLSGLGAQGEFQQEIRAAIPIVVESLKDSDSDVRRAACECLSGLRAHSEFQQEIRAAIHIIVESLKDSPPWTRQGALGCLSGLRAQAEFQQEIQAAIVIVVELLKDSNSFVRQAALLCVSGLGAQAEFQQEIQAAIPIVVESLKESDSNVCRAALECVSGLGAQVKFQQEIRATIPIVIESLKDSNSLVCWAAFNCLSRLGAQSEFQQEIRAAIPTVMESLKDSHLNVRRAALECLSRLGAQPEFQQEIQAAIPIIVELVTDSNTQVCQVALHCLSGLGAQAEFQKEIRAAIVIVVELLKDSDPSVRQAVIECLSGLGAQDREIILITLLEQGTQEDFGREAALASLSSMLNPT
ncbi:armadillo-type protein [Mycena epipterygia]|nr:armadillo-type protein [Mycena epipterygia]